MDNKLTNVFTYINIHHDYAQAFDQFERIFNRYFKNITNYKLIEEKFILEENELDDNLSIEEKLEALKRKFSK
jgi:hypothetical protein